MEIKHITGQHLRILDPIFGEMGWSQLPQSSIAIVAMDDKGVAGFHVLQLRPHAEPLYVRQDKVGTGLGAQLAGLMSDFLRETETEGFMAIADTPEAEKLCESFGMRRITSPVYMK